MQLKDITMQDNKQLFLLEMNMDQVHQEIGLLRVHIFKVLKLLLLKVMREFTDQT